MNIQSQDSFKRHGSEDGATLVVMLVFLVLVSLLGMSLLFTTEVELQSSKGSLDRTRALNDTDNALNEIFWRLDLEPGSAGAAVTVNSLTKYDASIDPDPFDLLSNDADDDGDGVKDEPDEMNLTRDWEVRIALMPTAPPISGKLLWGVIDTDATKGPPWGSKLALPTVQDASNWHEYSAADPASADALSMRFKLDTDTVVGDSEGDGPEIVFYDIELARNGVDDANTLTGLGGDGNAANDSPYNITYFDGATTYPASGMPVMVVGAIGRTTHAGQTLTRSKVEAEVHMPVRSLITKALCGCSALKMAGGGSTDSYRSSEGDYGVGGIYQNGDIGSNAGVQMGGTAHVGGRVEASGDVFVDISSPGTPTVAENVYAGGTVASKFIGVSGTGYPGEVPPPAPCECDALDVPALVAAAATTNDNATKMLPDGIHAWDLAKGTITSKSVFSKGWNLGMSSSQSIILTGGTYYFDSITLAASASIQVGVDTNGDGFVDGPPTQKVEIFVGGTVNLAANGLINNYRPTDVTIYAAGSKTDSIDISAAVEFRGMVFAPEMDADLTGSSAFKGALLAKDITSTGTSAIHFDEDLAKETRIPSTAKLLAWREVP